MQTTTKLGLSKFEATDKFNVTGETDSLNHNMELIDSAINDVATSAGSTSDLPDSSKTICENIANLSPFGHTLEMSVVPSATGTYYTYQSDLLKGKNAIVAVFSAFIGGVVCCSGCNARLAGNTQASNQYWGGEISVAFDSSTGTVTFNVLWMGSSQSISNFKLTGIRY